MVSKKNQTGDNFRNKKRKCEYFDRSYCKYGDKCDNEHPDNVCEISNCFDDKCLNRHPNPCNFGPRCHYYRKNTCLYSHVIIVKDDDQKEKVKKMESKLDEMNKKMKQLGELERKNKQIEEKINKFSTDSDLSKLIEKKIETFENQLKTLRKVIEEKDLTIINISKKVENLENKVKEYENTSKKHLDLEKVVSVHKKKIDILKEKLEISGKPEEKIKCTDCDFQSNSKHGLKTHVTRRHTKYNKENFPKQCDLCDKRFNSKEEIEKHVITHSYKTEESLKFKCNECDFWCPNKVSIESHIKKIHSENITCGVCDDEANDSETLESHISSCQIYKGCCDKTYRSVADLQEHVKTIHGGGRWVIYHIYMDPNNSEFLIEKTLYSDQLFRKK